MPLLGELNAEQLSWCRPGAQRSALPLYMLLVTPVSVSGWGFPLGKAECQPLAGGTLLPVLSRRPLLGDRLSTAQKWV